MRYSTKGQQIAINAIVAEKGLDKGDVLQQFGVLSTRDLTFAAASDFIRRYGDRAKILHKGKTADMPRRANGHATPDQIDAIDRLQQSLGWTDTHLRNFIKSKIHKNCHPTMLPKASASKVIKMLSAVRNNTVGKKKRSMG